MHRTFQQTLRTLCGDISDRHRLFSLDFRSLSQDENQLNLVCSLTQSSAPLPSLYTQGASACVCERGASQTNSSQTHFVHEF